jgi:hypothetical protein
MKVSDKVMKVVGTSVLLGTVAEERRTDGWLYVKVDWVETPGLKSIRANLADMLAIRGHEYDPETEWIRHDQLTQIDPKEMFESLGSLYQEDYKSLSRLQRWCVSSAAAKFLADPDHYRSIAQK